MSPERPRVVFDCMVFLQAAARRLGPAGACLTLAEQGLVELFVSDEILTEVGDVLRRPQIQSKFPSLTEATVAEFIERIQQVAVLAAAVPAVLELARDPKDEPYLNLA